MRQIAHRGRFLLAMLLLALLALAPFGTASAQRTDTPTPPTGTSVGSATEEPGANGLTTGQGSIAGRFHIVQPYETMFEIAALNDLTLDEIIDANPNVDPDNIIPGQKVFVPVFSAKDAGRTTSDAAPTQDTLQDTRGGTIHVVQQFETLFDIAALNGLTLDEIIAANPQIDPEVIWVGQQIFIPIASSATVTDTPTQEPTATVDAAVPAAPVTSTPTLTPAFTPTPTSTPTTTPTSTTRPTVAASATANPRTAPAATVKPVVAPLQTTDDGTHYFCPANSVVHKLNLPAVPIQVLVKYDRIYLLADGDLWGLNDGSLQEEGPLTPINLMPQGRQVGNFVINEFVYAAIDNANGDLLLLDKSNDIYRYTAAGIWEMEYAATQIPDQFPDPQFLAIQGNGAVIYALDADLSRIWRIGPNSEVPASVFFAGDLLTAVDMALIGPDATPSELLVLKRNSAVDRYIDGAPVGSQQYFSHSTGDSWPAGLIHVEDAVAAIDAQERSIVAFDPYSGEEAWRVVYRFEDMQRLRSATTVGDTILGIAGTSLYSGIMDDEAGVCAPVAYDDVLYFRGANVQAIMPGYQHPFADGWLPTRPRSFPGARRLYRYGVHVGIDLYRTEAPVASYLDGVLPVAAGTVIRADTDYVEMTPYAYQTLINQTDVEHRTSPQIRDMLLGRQVHLIHPHGVVTKYGHLTEISDGVEPGYVPRTDEIIGQVGVSGTSSGVYGTRAGEHLHMEVWVNGKYLGYGLTLYETMRLWQAVFEPSSSKMSSSPQVSNYIDHEFDDESSDTRDGVPQPTPTFRPNVEQAATATPVVVEDAESANP